jgi:hypothetical protein
VVTAPPPAEADVWPDGKVPMCFAAPADEDAWARDKVMDAASAWEAVANVEFDIRATCDGAPVSGADRRIPIRIVHDPDLFASASHLGVNLLRGGSITLNAEYLVTNRLCGRRGTVGREACFYADALHELGHALGFSHDHVSPRAPDCLARMQTPEPEVADETYYDPDSIMNYCNAARWQGRLSPADICSIRAAYGAPDGTRPTRSACYAMTGAPVRRSGRA